MESLIEQLIKIIDDEHKDYDKLVLSIGNRNSKAKVKLIRNTNNLKSQLLKPLMQFKKSVGSFPEWVKVDVITHEQEVLFDDVENDFINIRRNYISFGIALDQQWQLFSLPEEINANAFVRPSKNDKNSLEIAENNITHFFKKHRKLNKSFNLDEYRGKKIVTFLTHGYFIENDKIYNLYHDGYMKGIRKVNDLSKEIDQMIKTSTIFLKNEILPNGKFIYGYFPHFDRQINNYNVLRHSSSTYALTEGLTYLNDNTSIICKTIDYILENHYFTKGEVAYIFDDTKNINEIKLGQNASFIFAICEYLKTNPQKTDYLKFAQKVADGILTMINHNTMETIHVLNYPDLSVKENHRIIYYDGEAALALLRLYQIDNDPKWLKTVKQLFERFIDKEYWQYNDHWLSYCTNELVKISPDAKYYEFGMKNVSNKLGYIYYRETTFPTFLEMLVATYQLVQSAKNNGLQQLVSNTIDENKLLETIHKRADYERTGYFYPEIAMYFKNPNRILGGFFIKHHKYRVRIDDIEHYLSGYVQYQNIFK